MGIAEIIALAPTVVKYGSELYHFVNKIIDRAKQDEEWTTELQAQWNTKVVKEDKEDHMKTDEELGLEKS